MELRERIARAVVPHMHYEDAGWEESEQSDKLAALAVADDVIDALRLTREEERAEPRPGSTTKFAPHTVERYVTPWERPN